MKQYRNSNTTYFQRLYRRLRHGMYCIRNPRRDSSFKNLHITYYLLSDGTLITFREWHQFGKPHYLVAGTEAGCLSHWQRIQNKSK